MVSYQYVSVILYPESTSVPASPSASAQMKNMALRVRALSSPIETALKTEQQMLAGVSKANQGLKRCLSGVKRLPCQHEGLSGDQQHPLKNWTQQLISVIPLLRLGVCRQISVARQSSRNSKA